MYHLHQDWKVSMSKEVSDAEEEYDDIDDDGSDIDNLDVQPNNDETDDEEEDKDNVLEEDVFVTKPCNYRTCTLR